MMSQGQALLEKLKKSKNNLERNKIQVNLINSRLRHLKEEFEDISKQEKETENPNEIVDIVEKILEFNRQQQGKGLKVLTPGQMLSRLPIVLPQAKNRLLNNAKKIYQAREKTTEGFKSGIFPLNYDEEEEQELRDKEEENNIRDENGLIDYKRLEGLK